MTMLCQRSTHAGLFQNASGQSLIEVALMMPLLILLIGYAIDFGYFFAVAANVTSAARNATEYSVQGFESPAGAALPSAGPLTTAASVAAAATGDLGGLLNFATVTAVQVCSKSLGTTLNLANCSSFGATGSSYTPAVDPEAPNFVLQRVDITYTVQPPIPLSLFKISFLPNLQFHRQVSMRALD
jgi:Flp pilus assembly protein TadG